MPCNGHIREVVLVVFFVVVLAIVARVKAVAQMMVARFLRMPFP